MIKLISACFIGLIVSAFFTKGVQMVRYRNFDDLYLHKFDKDGEIKQLMYSEQLVENSFPVLCYVHENSKAYVMVSCSKLRSKLDISSSYQRIFRIFNSNHLCFVGHKPDWLILENELIDFVISITRIQSAEIFSASVANYLSESIGRKILSGLLKNNIEEGAENHVESKRRYNSNKKIPIGKIMNRPLAANAIFPNIERVVTPDSLYFWGVNSAGKCQKARQFVIGKVNPQVREKMESIQKSPSLSLIATLEDLLRAVDEYDLVETAVIFPESRRLVHILPTTKEEMLQQLQDKLSFDKW